MFFSKHNFTAIDPETIRINNSYEYEKTGQIMEMAIQKSNSEKYPYIDIIISDRKETLLLQIESIKNHISDSINSVNQNGVRLELTWSENKPYDFLGEEYILSIGSAKTYVNGSVTNSTKGWYLFREKENKLVQITLMGNQNMEYTIEDLSTWFEPVFQNNDSISSKNQESVSEPSSSKTVVAGNASNTRSATSTKTSAQTVASSKSNSVNESKTTVSKSNTPSKAADSKNPCASGHSWVAVTKNVHHKEVGHYENVEDYKSVKKYCCSVCNSKFKSVSEYYSHFDSTHKPSYEGDPIKLFRENYTQVDDTEPVTTKQWVVDEPAYDETVTTGYRCSVCGATK